MNPAIRTVAIVAALVPVLTWQYTDVNVGGFVLQSRLPGSAVWRTDKTVTASDVCDFKFAPAVNRPCSAWLNCQWRIPDKNRFYRICDGWECKQTAELTCECDGGTGCPSELYPSPATCP